MDNETETPDILAEKYLSVKDVADILRLTQSSVYGLIHEGFLTHAVIGKTKGYRISSTALREYIGKNTVVSRQ